MTTLVWLFLGMSVLISSFVTNRLTAAYFRRRHRKFIKKHKIVL
jgi:hypothetical protein